MDSEFPSFVSRGCTVVRVNKLEEKIRFLSPSTVHLLSYKFSHPHQKIKRKHDFLLNKKVIIDEKLSVEGREAQFSINRLKNK